MLRSITIILTITIVALHAMLGCCAHHGHSNDAHQIACAATVDCGIAHGTRADLCHDHVASANEDSEHDPAESPERDHECCYAGDCKTTLGQRPYDLEFVLSFFKSCQSMGNLACGRACDEAGIFGASARSVTSSTLSPSSSRATHQVWRL
ncbi:MAG: hypothetical protein KDA60_16420 [Planctomycetales bacterium]|nr:hypothetical protein [Planctomycetales bacterium]